MSSRSDVSFRAIARRRMSAFRRNQEGAAAIEFVLWMPFFIVLLAIITDFTFLYMTNSSMWSSAREAARAMSVREADAAEASNMITSSLIRGGNYYVKVDPLSSEVSAIIRIGMADASIFGIFGSVLNDDLVAIVRMRKEPMD
jgi:Flp pilus assembly pilin Flp